MRINDFLGKIMKNNALMFLLFSAIGIVLSNILRFEMIADFYNYHYFVPWAFFHQRTFVDVALAMENSYHNPLVEMPAYFIINHFNETPAVLYTFQGFWFGVLIFSFYKFCFLIFDSKQILGKIQIFLTITLVFGGFALMTQIGTSSNEIPVSIGVIVALFLLYREIFVWQTERKSIFLLAGGILGAMLGLKLTVVVYCLAAGISLILFGRIFKNPVKIILFFTLGGFLGFCLTHGYWSYILYKNMENPIFPYLNNVFKSPYYADKFLSYSTFYKKNWFDYLIFPYLASFQKDVRITSEAYMVDIRLALGYTLLIISVLSLIFTKNPAMKIKNNKGIIFLITFTFLAYLVWLQMFSIIRYAVPIEMLISLFVVKYFSSFRVRSLIGISLFSSLCIILLFALFSGLPYRSWGDRRHDDRIISFERVTLPKNTLVLGLSPSIGLAASQIISNNPDVVFANETSSFTLPGEYFYKKIEEYKQKSDYIAYVVSLKTAVREFDKDTPIYVVKNDNIEEVFANLQYIIKTELGRDKFYCHAVNLTNSLYKTFICIDKKDKETIFPAVREKSLVFRKKTT